MSDRAEVLILNARVLTLDPAAPRAEAVAIAGGKILAVGTEAELSRYRADTTEVIDAAGATVLPGFSENHMHLFSGAAELDHLQLAGVHGLEALTSAVHAYAKGREGQAVLFAQGADYTILDDERITRHHLDAILPNQALALFAPDHHTVWTNTAGLELAGILHGAEVGPGNEIVMGEDGLANGELREMEAFDALLVAGGYDRYRLGLSTGGEPDPAPTPEEFALDMDVMRLGLSWCARHGITTILNMDGNLYQLQVLSAIEKADGGLPCRVMVPFHYKNFMTLDALDKAEMMARTYTGDWLYSGTVKLFYDGVLDSWTAVMLEPYADRPDTCGDPLFSPEEFAKIAVEIDRRGLQIAVHAIGDGAVRAVLDGYEAARSANGPRDSRHRIEHIEVVHQDDIARFADLGVIASVQPPHPPGSMGVPLEPTVSRIGRDRWPLSYAYRTLKDAGARVCFASDWPVSPIDPIAGTEAAVIRKPWAEGDPDQAFTLSEALAAYITEGAHAEFREDRKGALKPGFFADLVVLDRDIESVPVDQIHTLRPVLTLCGGRTTYSSR